MPGQFTMAMEVAIRPDTSAHGPSAFIERFVATRNVDGVLERTHQHGAGNETITVLTAPTGFTIRDVAAELLVKSGEANADMALVLVQPGVVGSITIPFRVTSTEPARVVLGRFGVVADADGRRVTSIQIVRVAGAGSPISRVAATIED